MAVLALERGQLAPLLPFIIYPQPFNPLPCTSHLLPCRFYPEVTSSDVRLPGDVHPHEKTGAVHILLSWESFGGHAPPMGCMDLIRTSIYDKYSDSTNITTHLYHISRANRWGRRRLGSDLCPYGWPTVGTYGWPTVGTYTLFTNG